ncbi:hypothetical protein [Curtobacterium caseinilyticum]|uniref:Uncharacterized protein n=1 Tax=Curtobacterium caseinilyticum TaxID=3055137 RepID=A0ABT7TS68_9MICO|nr:hypothetical protein [Curtobacterium caseinilyticum]MDM7892449.1 hypothetical protein [Curtobacterium caseinilyticum]
MSSSDAQPPLSRRQARERERAAAASGQPVTPPPTVAAPTDEPEARRRPGSHVAPSPSGPAQSAARPASGSEPRSAGTAPQSAGSVFPLTPAPASATEIVPGTGGLTRRQLRLMREAEGQAVQPVPLQAPTPHSSDRTVQDVLGSVDRLDEDAQRVRPASVPSRPTPAPATARPSSTADAGRSSEVPLAPTPARTAAEQTVGPGSDRSGDAADDLDEQDTAAPAADRDDHSGAPEPSAESERLDAAAVAQATEADGSPDAIEPLSEAAAHAEEPRRHRSTWAPPEGDESDVDGDTPPASEDAAAAPTPGDVPSSSTPVVFPLSLDDDTNEVPVQRPTPADDRRGDADAAAPRVPAAFQRSPEPKPVTTAFEPPVGHWSQQAQDADDAEVHDVTGTRRVAVQDTNSIVLPNSALADPTGALNATGEVILTGSIDLPASLSSTGSHRPIDGAEVDRLLEQHDEQPETDASPVRASRAVSSHTSTRQVVLAAAKPKESRTPVILGVTVGAVGLAAAGVIIVALLTTHFGG